MNLDELRAVRDEERESGELQPLRPSFYEEARTFIEEIEAERDRHFQASDDPLSDPTVSRLNDKHSTATSVLESIFENRMSKLVKHALTATAGGDDEPPSMTEEERVLYDRLVNAIQATKREALEGADPDEAPDLEPIDDEESTGQTDPPAETDAGEQADQTEDEVSEDSTEPNRRMVRVVSDVGTILGVDEQEYELQAGDVVSLPIENAKALIKRDVAKPVSKR